MARDASFCGRLVLLLALITVFPNPLSLFSPSPLKAQPDSALTRCREAGLLLPLELTAQDRQTYQTARQEDRIYQIWETAEQVSGNTTYGIFANRLVLQLVCLGEVAPAERDMAVQESHAKWKSGKAFRFDLCQYITSGMGAGYCSVREENKQKLARIKQLTAITSALTKQQKTEIEQAVKAADQYFDKKAFTEELHGGSGHVAWRTSSAVLQKEAYQQRITDTISGNLPPNFPEILQADTTLNRLYQQVRDRLNQQPITGFNMHVTFADVQDVQRDWLGFRDTTAAMLAKLNQNVSAEQWRALLTAERSKALTELLQYK